MTNLLTLSECNDRLKNGDVIAYPTEAFLDWVVILTVKLLY